MSENLFIDSPLNGTLIALADVDDKIFSRGAAGKGVAIKNPDGKIFAPFGGSVKFFASPGVIGLKSFGGVELLIHVGLNTCKLVGESFKPQVAVGDIITRGQILLTFDPQEISRAGFDATTPVVVTNPENFGDIVFKLDGQKVFVQREGFFFTLKNFLCYNLRGGVGYA
ncbi:MAG: PTS glucose transporter subunit IIA [Selenomonadaceae bacterium]|nr:PTS glucose transporter subunit IIA [Selenomonadaceae bacterium]